MSYYKWKPSRSAVNEFVNKMNEIDIFCSENGIQSSRSNDSYYFELDGKKYRVSNHTVEKSNACAYDDSGNQIRPKYHPDGRGEDVIYIHASKTRIIDIYTDLKNGLTLDGRGFRK